MFAVLLAQSQAFDPPADRLIEKLPSILAITFIFGGWAIYASVKSVAENRRAARIAEQNAVLKKEMIDKGFSADEIVKVLEAGTGAEREAACKKGA